MWGFDSETHLIKGGMVAPRPVVFSMGRTGTWWLLFRRDVPAAFLRRIQAGDTLAAHNLAYDLVAMMAEWPALTRAIFDAVERGQLRCTFVRQCLIDIAAGEMEFRRNGVITKSGRGLDDLGQLYFKEHWEKENTHRLRYGELDSIHPDNWPVEAKTYPMDDAERAARVFHAQEKRARELAATDHMQGVWDAPDGEVPDELEQTKAALWLQLMSSWGPRTDPAAVRELREEHERNQKQVFERLLPTGLVRADGTRDMGAIRERVIHAYADRGLMVPATDPTERFPEGQVKADSETLIESGDPDLAALGESLSDAATIGTWLPHLEAGTRAPICVSYNVLVDTGRTSARNPNIQNPPRSGKIRQCFVPRKNFLFSFCDYDTAELRALAQVCIWLFGWSDLGDALRAGEDPHLSLAAQLLGISLQDAAARHEAGDKEVADARQMAKAANFGFPGGLGCEKWVKYANGYDPKFRETVDLRVAERLRAAWFDRWREMRKYFQVVSDSLRTDDVMQQFGSKRVRGGVRFTQAANGAFQGLIADGAKRAGWALARECYLGDWVFPPQDEREKGLQSLGGLSPLYGSRPVLFMHDEFGLEVWESTASLAARRQAYVQRMAMQSIIPDVPIKCGAALMRRWYKGAKPVEVEGHLVAARPIEEGGRVKWVADEGG